MTNGVRGDRVMCVPDRKLFFNPMYGFSFRLLLRNSSLFHQLSLSGSSLRGSTILGSLSLKLVPLVIFSISTFPPVYPLKSVCYF